MRMLLLTLAAAALLGGAAQAGEEQDAVVTKAVAAPQASEAKKVLIVCTEEERDMRSFSRDLGLPDFVTAKQVLADQGKAWTGARCITPTEMRRLSLNTVKPIR